MPPQPAHQSYQGSLLAKAGNLRRKSGLPTLEQIEATGMLREVWGQSSGIEGQAPLTACPPVAAGSLENPQALRTSLSHGSSYNFFPARPGSAPSEPLTFAIEPVPQASPCSQLPAPSFHKPSIPCISKPTDGLGGSTLPSTLKSSASKSHPLECFHLVIDRTSSAALKSRDSKFIHLPSHPSMYSPIYQATHPAGYPSIHPSSHPFIHIHLHTHLFIHSFIYLSITHLSTQLPHL